MERVSLRNAPSDVSLRAAAPTRGGVTGPNITLLLQRSVGNAAVAQLLRSYGSPSLPVQRQPVGTARGGPQIMAGDGTTPELKAELDRLVAERSALHVSTIEPETELRYNQYTSSISRLRVLLAERGDSTLPDSDVELTFDGSNLDTSSGQAWAAVSGRPDASGGFDYSPARQRQQDLGPIPAGTYWLDPEQLVNLSERWLYSWRYESAWGTHRITIHPFGSTRTFGRGGFFIHGGTSPGSAGCIDLTTGMASFARTLGSIPRPAKVKLNVRYPTP
jgi:hypothetical protein